MVKRLFKIQNLNASTIRTVMVADCSRFDSPDLLLDAGDQAGLPCRVFDLGGDSEEEAPDPGLHTSGSGRVKEGLRRMLDSVLDGHAQLSDCALEAKVAELLAHGHTKPPECSDADTRNKYLIFTTGCLTYSPHQIGNGGQGRAGPGRVSSHGGAPQTSKSISTAWIMHWDPTLALTHSILCKSGENPGRGLVGKRPGGQLCLSVKCRQCVWTTRAVLRLGVPWW